jgi:hypothetical protein
MGNRSSVATIGVRFDQPEQVAGKLVTGKVYLQVNQSSVSCRSIGSRVIGAEHTEIHYTESIANDDGGASRSYTRTARSASHFMDAKFCLATVPNDALTPGSYEYPFSFTIPNGAPATMNHNIAYNAPNNTHNHGNDRRSHSCCVKYNIEVWLERPGLMRWDIKNNVSFTVVNEVPENATTPLIMEPSMEPITTMCCYRRGEVYVGSALSSTMLVSGGQTTIKYAIQNVSTIGLNAIEISVIEKIFFRAENLHQTQSKQVMFVRLTPSNANFDMGALSKAELQEQREQRALRRQNQGYNHPGQASHNSVSAAGEYDILENLNHILSGESHKINAVLSGAAKSTYHGSIIEVKHIFQIKVCTAFGTSNPVFARPVLVFSRSSSSSGSSGDSSGGNASAIAAVVPEAVPVDWSPHVAARADLPPLAMMVDAIVYDAEQGNHSEDSSTPMIYPACSNPSPSAPPMADGGGGAGGGPLSPAQSAATAGVAALLGLLKGSYDPCGMLDVWLNNPVNNLSQLRAEDYALLFKAIREVMQQLRFADVLAARLEAITCSIVAKSALGADEMVRREVVEKLLRAGPLIDRADHIGEIQEVLTAFQFMTVERYII